MICWKIAGAILPQTVTVDIEIGHDGCLSSVVLWRLERSRLVSRPLWGLVWQNRCCHWVWWRDLPELAMNIDGLPALHWGQERNQRTTELSNQLSLIPRWVLPTVSMLLVWWPSFLLGVLSPCPPVVVLRMVPGVWDGTQVSGRFKYQRGLSLTAASKFARKNWRKPLEYHGTPSQWFWYCDAKKNWVGCQEDPVAQ